MDPDDGAIVSMVGGFDYYSNKFNRVTQAKRQLGSGFKPFLYSAALEEGFTPASVILDMPIVLENAGEEENWRPENSDGTVRRAHAPARGAGVFTQPGVHPHPADHRPGCGRSSMPPSSVSRRDSFPHDLTMALGSQSASPLEMATGFSVFANGGFKVTPYYISRIEDSSGKVVFENKPLLACLECETPAQVPLLRQVNVPAPADAATADGAPLAPA